MLVIEGNDEKDDESNERKVNARVEDRLLEDDRKNLDWNSIRRLLGF